MNIEKAIVYTKELHALAAIKFTVLRPNMDAALRHQRHYGQLNETQKKVLAVCDVGGTA